MLAFGIQPGCPGPAGMPTGVSPSPGPDPSVPPLSPDPGPGSGAGFGCEVLQPVAVKVRSSPNPNRFENLISFILNLSWNRARSIWPNWVVNYFPKFGKYPCIVWLARQVETKCGGHPGGGRK